MNKFALGAILLTVSITSTGAAANDVGKDLFEQRRGSLIKAGDSWSGASNGYGNLSGEADDAGLNLLKDKRSSLERGSSVWSDGNQVGYVPGGSVDSSAYESAAQIMISRIESMAAEDIAIQSRINSANSYYNSKFSPAFTAVSRARSAYLAIKSRVESAEAKARAKGHRVP